MKRILLYEFTTGGGCFTPAFRDLLGGSLIREGTAMIRALADDFSALPETAVTVLRDVRLPAFAPAPCRTLDVASSADERRTLEDEARVADGVLLIAPECGGALEARCRWVEAAGGRLLSPSSEFVRVTADKNATAARLSAAAVPIPVGHAWRPADGLPPDFSYPAIVKPADGAGSLGVQRVPHGGAAVEMGQLGTIARLEQCCEGLAASVGMLCGPGGPVPLPACSQRLSRDGSYSYLGGRVPLAACWQRRATALAQRAVAALPAAVGYVGIDLVLARDGRAEADVVIEVNPRLTTSYVGLRRLSCINLAGAMLQAAAGEAVHVRFADAIVSFRADGRTRMRWGKR